MTRPLCVVFDTNAVYGDLRLTGVLWEVIASAVQEEDVFVRFAAVTIDEMTAKYRERVDAAAVKAQKAAADLAGDGTLAEQLVKELRQSADGYRDYLEDRLEALGAERLDYPDVTHEVVTARALSRTPPFNSNGGGYRDTLLWLSALAEAEELGADLVMVSDDKAAFQAKGGDGLHPALRQEASDRSVTAMLAVDALSVATKHLRLADVDDAALVARSENLLELLCESLGDAATATSSDLDAQALALPRSAREIDVVYTEDVRDLDLKFVRTLPDGRTVHSFTATVDAQLDMLIDELDADMADYEVQSRFGLGDVRARTVKSLEVEGLATFNFGTADSCEVGGWRALPDDDEHVYWDDPCGCFPRARRSGAR